MRKEYEVENMDSHRSMGLLGYADLFYICLFGTDWIRFMTDRIFL